MRQERQVVEVQILWRETSPFPELHPVLSKLAAAKNELLHDRLRLAKSRVQRFGRVLEPFFVVTVDSHACSFGTCGRHIRSVRGEVSVLRFWTEKLFCGSGEYEEYESLL